VVVSHVDATANPWRVTTRVLRLADEHCVAERAATMPPEQPNESLQALAKDVCDVIAVASRADRVMPVPGYAPPTGEAFRDYLLRLEQMLAVRCAGMESEAAAFLSGEREIVAGTVRLCVEVPNSVSTRVLLVQLLKRMKAVHPAAVLEHEEAIRQLQRAHPMPEYAVVAIDAMIDEALSPSANGRESE